MPDVFDGAVTLLRAAANGVSTVPAVGSAYVVLLGYAACLVTLIALGIWGFRLGDGGRDDGNGRGGSDGPDPEPPSPSGGRELTDDFPAWEDQFRAQDNEPAQPESREKIPAGSR